jgi:DNA adenine methylase
MASTDQLTRITPPGKSRPKPTAATDKSDLVEPLMKPLLKWAGGKRWLVPELEPLWQKHKHRRYVEPFCGGLAAVLGLRPASALLNDINPHLINFYREVQKGLRLTIDMKNDEKLFYRHRKRFNRVIQSKDGLTNEAAQLFYYLNRTCFNGLCRFNKSGGFNVPFGTYKSINYATDFLSYTSSFSEWQFVNGDIESLAMKSGDFVYADPPYDVEFTTYSAGGFSWEDQKRTAELLARHDGPVVISNQATQRITELYQALGFTVRFLNGPRRISCTGDRTSAREVLASKGI